jgi:predicted PurR-regulated permease PerM
MSVPVDRTSRVEVVVSGATVLRAALVAVAVYAVIVAHEVLLTIGLAVVFAFGLDPLVVRLTQRGMGRGAASLLVFAALFLIASVLVLWVATPIWDETRQLVDDVPAYIDDLKDEPLVKQLNEGTEVADKAESVAKDAAQEIPKAASALLGITGSLVGSVLSVVTLVFLTLFLLIGLPDFMRGVLAILPPPPRRRGWTAPWRRSRRRSPTRCSGTSRSR